MRSRVRTISAIALCVGVLIASAAVVPSANGEVTDADIEQAKQRLLAAQSSADAAASALAAAEAAEAEARDRIARVEDEIDALIERRNELTEVMTRRAVEAYKNAGRTPELAYLVQAAEISDVTERSKYVDQVLAADVDAVRELSTVKEDLDVKLDERREAHDERVAARKAANAEKSNLAASLEKAGAEKTRLETQKEAEDRARAEAARRALEEAKRRQREARERAAREAAEKAAAERAAAAQAATASRSSGGSGSAPAAAPPPPPAPAPAPAPSTGGKVCPVGGGTSFSDSFGAPRSSGRSHQGVDMFAAHGTTLVAIENGRISRTGSGGLGGITLWLQGDSGASYYYAHNSANLAGSGQRVSAGQAIARVGTTGNARGTSPHVHFEYHPGGGGAVNPTPLVSSLC